MVTNLESSIRSPEEETMLESEAEDKILEALIEGGTLEIQPLDTKEVIITERDICISSKLLESDELVYTDGNITTVSDEEDLGTYDELMRKGEWHRENLRVTDADIIITRHYYENEKGAGVEYVVRAKDFEKVKELIEDLKLPSLDGEKHSYSKEGRFERKELNPNVKNIIKKGIMNGSEIEVYSVEGIADKQAKVDRVVTEATEYYSEENPRAISKVSTVVAYTDGTLQRGTTLSTTEKLNLDEQKKSETRVTILGATTIVLNEIRGKYTDETGKDADETTKMKIYSTYPEGYLRYIDWVKQYRKPKS